MIDYVLVNRRFHTSILDTRVFRSTYVDTDHELVISTIRFKIKAKRVQNTGLMKRQVSGLPLEMRIGFKVTLAAALPSQPTEEEDAEKVWGTLKSALSEAQDTLPKLPQRQEKEWVAEELRNLARKKREAWQHLWQAGGSHLDSALQSQYKQYCKLTKTAAERARNKWWRDRTVEAEKRAQIAEKEGRGGSMIKELRLLKNHFAKASTPSLLTKDGTSSVTSDEDKHREDSSVPVLTDDQLGSPPTEEDLRIAISQLNNGKAPGEDGTTAEILRLGVSQLYCG